MDDYDLVDALERRIAKVYTEVGLISLRFDHDGERSFAPHGVDLHSKYMDTVKPDETIEVREDQEVLYFDRFQIFDDLVGLSDQAIYFTAWMHLLNPLINNPLDYPLDLPGYENTMFPDKQNAASKRSDSISDTLAEKTYAYWARLGNLLNRYLPNPLKPRLVDFSRVMEQYAAQMGTYHGNAGYQWLKRFKDNEQKELNDQRRLIVHHQTGGTWFKAQHRDAFFSREKMEVLMEERYSRPDFFKSHMNLNLEALDKCLDLIADLPTPPPKIVSK